MEGFPTPAQGRATYTVTATGELYGQKWVEGLDDPGSEIAWPITPENMSGG